MKGLFAENPAYMAAHPRSERPAPKIDVGSREQITRERQAFSRYQAYFSVPDEIR